MFSLIISGNTASSIIDQNHTCTAKESPLPNNNTDYGQVFVIFRIKKRLAVLDHKVAIVFEGRNGGSEDRDCNCDITFLKLFEKTPGSGKWIAVTMLPTNQQFEFKCAVVNAADEIVEYENGVKTRQIHLGKSHLCVSLPWSKTDTLYCQRRLPKNLGKISTCILIFFIFN